MADNIKNARTTVENSRTALTNANQFQALYDLAPIIADLLRLEGQVRFAEQGYTGISPAVRINPQQLDRLATTTTTGSPRPPTSSIDYRPRRRCFRRGRIRRGDHAVVTARGQVNQLDQAFKARVQVIEGIRIS